MKEGLRLIRSCMLLALLAAGCTTRIGPTPLKPATQHIPEEQLLDVGIKVFDPGVVSAKAAKKLGESQEIREAEAYFIPVHLRQTMEASSQYGNVRVLPMDLEGMDVQVEGKIEESNGEELIVAIQVQDATGRTWFRRDYREVTNNENYIAMKVGRADGFQNLYNAIANDIAEYKDSLSPAELKRIQDTARMRFAKSFAPDSYSGHIKIKKDKAEILKLPAENDPQMRRILDMREREFMFFDTLDGHYQSLYLQMWEPYGSWRKSSLTEILAIREIEHDSFVQKLTGALMIAGAILMEVLGAEGYGTIEEVLIIGGIGVIINGVNISSQREIHAASLKELSDSFKTESKPIVMEVNGKIVELRGTTEEQYGRWRDILRKLYEAETGLPAAPVTPAGP